MPEDLQRLVILQKLYICLATHARVMGDLSLDSYACMLDIIECGGRCTRRDLERTFGAANLEGCLAVLEAFELVEQTRSASDRRVFALRGTERGLARAQVMDEALATALVSTSGRLTEETFNHLEGLLLAYPSQRGAQREVVTLLSASMLTDLCRYHAAVERASAFCGTTSTQAALMALFHASNGTFPVAFSGQTSGQVSPTQVPAQASAGTSPIAASSLGAWMALPTASVLLQLELLAERELLQQEGEDVFWLTEAGARKIEDVTARFKPSLERLGGQQQLSQAQAEVLHYMTYLLNGAASTKGAAVAASADAASNSQAATLAQLYTLLADVFTYPGRQEAEQRTSARGLAELRARLEAADIADEISAEVWAQCTAQVEDPSGDEALALRSEFTRMFYSSPHVVSLNGSDWVRRGLTDFARAHGERAAVGLAYRQLGLKNRKGVNLPFDNMVSELDYLSYVTQSEAEALDAGDAVSAYEWGRLRSEFALHHFNELADGVVDSIMAHSDNVFLRLYASILAIVSTRG